MFTYDQKQQFARHVCCVTCRAELFSVGALLRGLAWRHC